MWFELITFGWLDVCVIHPPIHPTTLNIRNITYDTKWSMSDLRTEQLEILWDVGMPYQHVSEGGFTWEGIDNCI
jgi:hypothetical protein